MKRKNLFLIVIILLAALLRFYNLGKNPPSIDWDEASIGYNAYSLLKTGKDEFGNSWPISIRSFDDYKPPLYVYATIPSVAIFGLNEFAVRFPSALTGTLTVIVFYFLTKEIFNDRSKAKGQKLKVAMVASFLLAINPWHLQFSRVAFEANLALFFFVLGVYLLFKAINNQSLYYYSGVAVAFAATMYSYHSARVVVPLFLLLISWIYRKSLLKNKSKIFVATILGTILLIPMLITFMRAYGQSRFTTVSVFTNRGIFPTK